jgi:hypothetical protein
VISPAELRAALQVLAADLLHPYKPSYALTRLERVREPRPHDFGRLVYGGDGSVGGSFEGRYLIARGDNAEDSLYALGHKLGLVTFDVGVTVDEVDAGWFWLYCNPEGKQSSEV